VATEIAQLINEGVARLARVTDRPQHEAEILLAAALAKPHTYLLVHPDERILDCDATDRYESHITRRAHGEPIAYILREKEFWSLPLEVTPDVLIPRPETELAVELALAHLPTDAPGRVLDLAAGSGAIAIAIAHERPRLHVVATDVSPAAVLIAASNAARLGLGNTEFRPGSWYATVPDEHFTLIVSNPPYIAEDDARVERDVRRYEPHAALFAGADGLEALREVIGGAGRHLLPGGWLIVEHGDLQGDAVRQLFLAAGFESVRTHPDLAHRDRCTEGRWPVALHDDRA
jgi:release factor glutamine methyltransferase